MSGGRKPFPWETGKWKSGGIVEGGGEREPNAPTLQSALAVAEDLLAKLVDFTKTPRKVKEEFPDIKAFHEAVKMSGFHLIERRVWNPGYQLLYQGPEGVVVKVKTKGYGGGVRPHGTLSIELTDGKGFAWENTWCKIDATGSVITRDGKVMGRVLAKTLLSADQIEMTEEQGRYTPLAKTLAGKTDKGDPIYGKPRPIARFEAIEGGQTTPADKNAFADRGHIDFPPGFKAEDEDALALV